MTTMSEAQRAQWAAAVLGGTTCQSCKFVRVINRKWRCAKRARKDGRYKGLPQAKTCDKYDPWERG